jgi:UDP-N-acetylglucosamine--N-acetylmuramyl-(pentapeptide) pyrophosphoryl-undecaprenol N-acetylglucosamine transferase
MKILFVGGGTLGPVTPLLAVAATSEIRSQKTEIIWVGTEGGPERELVEAAGYRFLTLPVAKLPRYFSLQLFRAPFDFFDARKRAGRILDAERPDMIVSAGGFTAVPIVMEAKKRGIRCIAHQLDYVPGLSNKLVAKRCDVVTTSFAYTTSPFGRKKTHRIATPVRFSTHDSRRTTPDARLPTHDSAKEYFGFNPSRPVIFIVGGGTGAEQLNRMVPMLRMRLGEHVQTLHITGRGKIGHLMSQPPEYVVREFMTDEMLNAYIAADLVISRAGMGAISELAALAKPAILVPYPHSPQEANAHALADAVRVVHTRHHDWERTLVREASSLLADVSRREALGQALHEALPTDDGGEMASFLA